MGFWAIGPFVVFCVASEAWGGSQQSEVCKYWEPLLGGWACSWCCPSGTSLPPSAPVLLPLPGVSVMLWDSVAGAC